MALRAAPYGAAPIRRTTGRRRSASARSCCKKKGQGNTKNGNGYLVWTLVQVVNFAPWHCDEAKRFFERKGSQDQPGSGHQGAGAKTGASLLTHAQGAKTL